jgi:hypothetical protein
VAETLDKKHPESQSATLHRASSRAPAIVISLTFFALAFISAATAYALSNFDRSAKRSPHEKASAPIPDPVTSATLKDIQLVQQKNAAVLESLMQSSAVQQTDLKRISDQLSLLAVRADVLQSNTPETTSAIPQPNDRARVVKTSHKKPSLLPRPIGPVSVRGEPLSPAPAPRSRAE